MSATTLTADRAHSLLDELGSKSAVIRLLASEGYSRGDIARALNIRYQFVRNVLVNEAIKQERASKKK